VSGRRVDQCGRHVVANGTSAHAADRADVRMFGKDDGVTKIPPDEPFLVCYDYGMGGLWGVLMAPSLAAIRVKYPELDIANGPPTWMTPERFVALSEEPLWLDDEPPQGLLRALVSDRGRD